MPRYNLAPIVRPSDLLKWSIPRHVAEAVRNGTARLVGFDKGQGDALALLERREFCLAREPKTRVEPARRWVSMADIPGAVVSLDEPDATPWRGGRGAMGGVTGPSRRGG
ncbi:hypothetical protein A3862_05200 [Methylobacterium sp. XJLW]|jgi:hypothetical protein|uniref:hypothetical protein n=1 Tax=Methylobacterium sp. XJLW TaxID=739141 RepID=UPI000DAAE2EE|nr:hypothetical protein [Methylobacterium sp. XJLW]AWV14979.1 hypothetical protein A3862_05200 [Methylobacterium sp. XJLW]